MSQLVACRYSGGVLIAADRRVVTEQGGRQRVHSQRKLFPLGTAAAVATSGAAVGILVSRTLSRLLGRRGPVPFDDLEEYALDVFQREYEEFVRQGTAWFAEHPEAHRLSYVLLAGGTRGEGPDFRFYASEAHGEPYRLLPTGPVLTAPRRLGLEGRLTRALAAGASGPQVRDLVTEGLELIARREDAVAGPFDLAVVEANGVTLTASE